MTVCLLRASVAAAQIPGSLDYPLVSPGSVPTMHADLSVGVNEDSGNPISLGVRFGFPWLKGGVWAGLGVCPQCNDGLHPLRVGVGVALGGSPAVAPVGVTVQTGVGLTRYGDENAWGIPLGLNFAFKAGPDAHVWVMPGLTLQGIGSTTTLGFSAMGGIKAGLTEGFGVHAALQWLAIDGSQPLAVGGGLYFRL